MPVPLAQNSTMMVMSVASNSSCEMLDSFAGITLETTFCIPAPPFAIWSPKCTVRPMAVPMITAKITAGIFSIRIMLEMPMVMEQAPKIIFRLSLKFRLSLWPATVPTSPPSTIDSEFTIIPIGIAIFLPFIDCV